MTEPLKQAQRVRPASPTQTQETVRVIYGVHSLDVNIAGRTVGEVRATLRQALNIGPQAIAVVDGREVLESVILQVGEVLEFVRLAGEKGWRKEWLHIESGRRNVSEMPVASGMVTLSSRGKGRHSVTAAIKATTKEVVGGKNGSVTRQAVTKKATVPARVFP